jgi:hypothetical protein
LGDREGEARALQSVGNVALRQRRYTDALQAYQQALTLFQQVGDAADAARVRDTINRINAARQPGSKDAL